MVLGHLPNVVYKYSSTGNLQLHRWFQNVQMCCVVCRRGVFSSLSIHSPIFQLVPVPEFKEKQTIWELNHIVIHWIRSSKINIAIKKLTLHQNMINLRKMLNDNQFNPLLLQNNHFKSFYFLKNRQIPSISLIFLTTFVVHSLLIRIVNRLHASEMNVSGNNSKVHCECATFITSSL